jgi:hypothetical protein
VYALNNPVIAKDPTGGPVWLIPVAIYLGYRALESAAETGVEAGIAKATGDEDFSVGGTFVKNMAVNTVVGLVPGAVEAKLGTKAAVYGTKLAIRTVGDATYDTLQGKGTLEENLVKSGVGNVGGDALGAALKTSGSAIVKKLRSKADDAVDASTKKAMSEGSDKVARKVAARLSDDQLRRMPKEIAAVLRSNKMLFGDKSAVAVLQGEIDGQIVTLVTTTSEKTTKALKTLQKRGLIDEALEIVESTRVLGESEKTGRFVKRFGPKGTDELFVHAEQVLAVEATQKGLKQSRVATSINACKDVCTPTFGPGGDLYPEITHLNPHGYQATP